MVIMDSGRQGSISDPQSHKPTAYRWDNCRPAETPDQDAGLVRVAIPCAVLARMLLDRQLCIADLHCLDRASKQSLWQLCRFLCANDCCKPSQASD